MSDNPAKPTRRKSGRRRRRARVIWWSAIGLFVLLGIFILKPVYHDLKGKRADQFAAAGDALVAAGKWNDAVKQYRAALQLDPLGYHALQGAARLASRADRPEAIDLWQQVIKLPQSTLQDRQEYAELLIRSDRLSLAEKTIEQLLKTNPDTKTLGLASRYERKFGDKTKAVEFARLAVQNAPGDEAARFQLAALLAQSTDQAEQGEARKVLWELASKDGRYKKPALEALATAPELAPEERERLWHALEEISPKNLTDELLAADVRIQIQPDDADRIYDQLSDRWRNGTADELVQVARWFNLHQQAERVLTLFPIERALDNDALLLARLDALAVLQRWNDIDDVLTRQAVTLDPSVIESFRGRTAQERGATLDAEVHWNHAISLAGSDPAKLRFVANFAEQSHANGAAIKAYEQLARFPQHADVANRGTERVSQRSGDAAIQRGAAEKIAAAAPEDPNAIDQAAYLNLLLDNDVEKNAATAKQLAQKYSERLSFRVTAALACLRQADATSALAQFKGPAIEWNRTPPAWRAVYAATLLANDRKDDARNIIMTIPLERLSSQERALIQPTDESNDKN